MDKHFLLVFSLFCCIEEYDLQLSYMVCQKFCRNLTFNHNNLTYIHHCCKSDYCNMNR
ncbi:Prostate and testis expressed protein 3 [Myotis brandtii]|uniref:Prostate and testis expressed protein 3 n=1 Tax=Myotis brandtii TaxID=109478 RepID=S7N3E8_MYOBR|nr:Prostate and testis expressed protein 3 [Myotis brandtii]